jgi:hypothetical protein
LASHLGDDGLMPEMHAVVRADGQDAAPGAFERMGQISDHLHASGRYRAGAWRS